MPDQLKVTQVPLSKLTEDPRNARVHSDKNLSAIKESLTHFGQVEPLVVRKGTGVVIGGNGRLAAMRALKWETAAVHYVDVTDEQATALGLALNRTAELATWNSTILVDLLDELDTGGFDIETLGWDAPDLDALSPVVTTPDVTPPGDPPAGEDAGGTTRFQFGPIKGVVSQATFDAFMARYTELRKQHATLDDVLGAWIHG